MQLTTWHYIGIVIFLLDLIWIAVYYYYATVKIYNYIEGDRYHYLGFLWIRKKPLDSSFCSSSDKEA